MIKKVVITPGNLYKIIIRALYLFDQNNIHVAIKGDVLFITKVILSRFHVHSYECIYKNSLLKFNSFDVPQPEYTFKQIT